MPTRRLPLHTSRSKSTPVCHNPRPHPQPRAAAATTPLCRPSTPLVPFRQSLTLVATSFYSPVRPAPCASSPSLAQLLLRNRHGDPAALAATPDPLDPLRGRGALAVWLDMDQEEEAAVGAEGPPGAGSTWSGRGPGAVLRSSRALTAGAPLPRQQLPPPAAANGGPVVGLAGVSTGGGGGGAGRDAGGVGQVVRARVVRAAVEALRGAGQVAAGGRGQSYSTSAAAAEGAAAVGRNAALLVESTLAAGRGQQQAGDVDQRSAQQQVQAGVEAEAQAVVETAEAVRGLLCGGSRLHAAAAAQAAAAAAVSALVECRTAAGVRAGAPSLGTGEGGGGRGRGTARLGAQAGAVGGSSAAAVGGWHVWIGEDPKPYVGRGDAAAAGAGKAGVGLQEGEQEGVREGTAARSGPAGGAEEVGGGSAEGVDAGGPGAAGVGGDAPGEGRGDGRLCQRGLRALVPCHLPGKAGFQPLRVQGLSLALGNMRYYGHCVLSVCPCVPAQ